jgi:hypothetical protein
MRRTTIEIALTLFFFFSSTLFGRTFVVSTGGNDANAGTIAAPWRTIAKANATLQAGDTVRVRAGSYSEVIQPAHSGAQDQPIVYAAYGDGPVILLGESVQKRGVVAIGWDLASQSQGNATSYIVVDGFQIRYQFASQLPDVPVFANRFAYVQISNRSSVHNIIRNCTIVQDGDALQNFIGAYRQVGISVEGAQYTLMENNDITGMWLGIWLNGPAPRFNTIRHNTIHDVGSSMVDIGDPEDGTSILQGNLIEDNTFTNSVNEDGIQFEPNYKSDYSVASNRGTIIRNNIVRGCVENAFDLKGAADVVIEGNIVYANTGDDDGSVGGNDRSGGMGGVIHGGTGVPGLPSATRDAIIRNNVFFDNYGVVGAGDGYKIYNNTMISNNRDYTGPDSPWRANPGPGFTAVLVYSGSRISIRNNIIAEQGQGELALNPYGMTNCDVDYNMYANANRVYFSDAGGALFTQFDLAGWQQRLAGRGMAGAEQHSFIAPPAFVNVPLHPARDHQSYDFQLSTTSAARDAGGPLTVTMSGGSGQSVPVADAGFFCDGYGRTDVADSIVIGTNPAVKITAVDLANNVIRVETPLAWSNGAGVFRPYRGTAPDLGAYESGGSAPPATTPPAAVQLVTPAASATGVLLQSSLTWTATSTAVSYQVQVSLGSAFLNSVADVSGITATSFALPSLTSGTVYYWRVRATNAGGTGPWSGVRSFTTATTTGGTVAPAAVQLASPPDGATATLLQPTLTWTATSTAVSYQVQVSVGSAFSNTTVDVSGISGTSYAPTSLANSTVYFWRVRATNAGGTGPWSNARSFTTTPAIGGGGGVTSQILRNNDFESGTQEWSFYTGGVGSFVTTTPAFSGSAAARVSITTTADNIQLYQQGVSLEANTIYRLTFAGYSSSGRDVAVSLLQQTSPFTNYGLQTRIVPLSTGWRTYSIYMKTKSFSGTITDARLQFWFTGLAQAGDQYWLDALQLLKSSAPPLPTAPAFLLPAAGATDQSSSLMINWTGSEGADGYHVQLAKDPSFSSLVSDSVVIDTVLQVGQLEKNTRYYRRVSATNISGTGPYTSPSFFTTGSGQPEPAKREGLPMEIQLDQNFPNPFNPATVIRYRLPAQTHVSLIVYNTLGAQVAVLVDSEQPEGEHSVPFDGAGMPTGAYFCRLHANGVIETRKMMLAR